MKNPKSHGHKFRVAVLTAGKGSILDEQYPLVIEITIYFCYY